MATVIHFPSEKQRVRVNTVRVLTAAFEAHVPETIALIDLEQSR